MKRRRIYVGASASLLVASALAVIGYLGMYFQIQTEALRWNLEVQVRAPVYANPSYPYGSQSPPNPVIGYLEVGSKPHVRRVAYDDPWPYREV